MSVALPEEEQLSEVTENVWSGFLNIPLHRAGESQPAACEVAASISIEGAWNGSLTVCCSRTLANRVAASMFGSADLGEELCSDALGEIANIIGGNIKATLPAPSRLGLPQYHVGWSAPNTGEVVSFRSDGEPLYVLLAGRAA
jgi:chemotaxis protein CheX